MCSEGQKGRDSTYNLLTTVYESSLDTTSTRAEILIEVANVVIVNIVMHHQLRQ